jgi:pilus assembly protein Flp/PilA
MTKLIKKLWTDEEGAAAAEYVLILALAALAIIGGATALGTSMNNSLTTSAGTVANPNP